MSLGNDDGFEVIEYYDPESEEEDEEIERQLQAQRAQPALFAGDGIQTTKDFGPFFTARIEQKDEVKAWMAGAEDQQPLISTGYAGEVYPPYRGGVGIAIRRPYGARIFGIWYRRGLSAEDPKNDVSKRQMKKWKKQPLPWDQA